MIESTDRTYVTQAEGLREQGASEELIAKATALYDKMNEMTEEERSALVITALQVAHHGMSVLLDNIANDKPSARADQFVAVQKVIALLASAGYAEQRNREGWGEGETGPTERVIETLKYLETTVHETVREELRAGISPENQKIADAVIERVKERIAAGEDPEAAFEDESSRITTDESGEVVGYVPSASTGARFTTGSDGKTMHNEVDPDVGYGMYL